MNEFPFFYVRISCRGNVGNGSFFLKSFPIFFNFIPCFWPLHFFLRKFLFQEENSDSFFSMASKRYHRMGNSSFVFFLRWRNFCSRKYLIILKGYQDFLWLWKNIWFKILLLAWFSFPRSLSVPFFEGISSLLYGSANKCRISKLGFFFFRGQNFSSTTRKRYHL